MESLALRATVVWLGMLVLAFVNGALREFGLKRVFGMDEPWAHRASCFTGVLFWTSFLALVWGTYNIFAGEFWGLVILWIGLMPMMFFLL